MKKAKRKNRILSLNQDPIEVKVSKLSHEGRGIASIGGKTTFIRGALPGETVLFQYTRQRAQYDEGEVTRVLHASPDRVQAKCEAFWRCGGCSLQHLSPAQQIAHKQTVLADHLQHFGHGIMPKEWLPPLQSHEWGYRHKARLGVRYVEKKGGALVGFRETNGRYVTDMQRCEVLHPSVGEHIQTLRDWLSTLEAKASIPQIEVAIDDQHTAIILRHLEPLSVSDQDKIKTFAQQMNWWVYLQSKGPDTIQRFYPNEIEVQLSYQHPDHCVKICFKPQDFTQVNATLNRMMVNRVIGLLDLQPSDTVLDLFCGLGNFTLPIARYAKSVVGVEGDAAMLKRAAENARHNDIKNVEFYAANLFEAVNDHDFMRRQYDKILLDPPRAGAEAIVHQFRPLGAKRIIYVSCDPATLARDANILVNEYGYHLSQAGVMDMFPHTTHVESIAVFDIK